MQQDNRDQVRVRTELMEKKLLNMTKNPQNISSDELEYYRDLTKEEKDKFMSPLSSNPYLLALEIKKILESEHLSLESYRTIEHGEDFYIEFSLSGSTLGFFSFLKRIYENGFYYKFPYFAIKNEKSGISSTFTIGYDFYE
jgi:hypothetical protein